MAIVVSQPGERAFKIEQAPFVDETELQGYVVTNPECLPMEEIDEDLKLVVLAREFPTRSGSIDAVGIDNEGSVYVIEAKLYRNQDKRKVIAQVLDHGASLWMGRGRSGDFVARIRESRSRIGIGHGTLEEQLGQAFDLDLVGVQRLLEVAETKLAAGRLRFIVLVDELDDRLKELITFVNEHSSFSVFGVGLELFSLGAYTIAIPRMFGAEVRPTESGDEPQEDWNQDRFFGDLASRMPRSDAGTVRAVYNFANEHADSVSWGRGAVLGSFNARFDRISPRSVFSVYSDGRFAVHFRWLRKTVDGRAVVKPLGQRLKALKLPLPADYEDHHVGIPFYVWVPKWRELETVLRETVVAASLNGCDHGHE